SWGGRMRVPGRKALAAAGLIVATGVLATVAAATGSGDRSKKIERAIDDGRARNVILLIGDGMGDSEITSARYYAYGAAGRLPGIDALPFTGEMTTYSLVEDPGQPDHGKPEYVPDSAATGTAWATGRKTSN